MSSKEWFVSFAEVAWGGADKVFETRWFDSEHEASEFCFHAIRCGADDYELGRVTKTLKMIVPMCSCDDCRTDVPPVLLRRVCLDGKPADICPLCYGPTYEDIMRHEAELAEEADKAKPQLVYHANA